GHFCRTSDKAAEPRVSCELGQRRRTTSNATSSPGGSMVSIEPGIREHTLSSEPERIARLSSARAESIDANTSAPRLVFVERRSIKPSGKRTKEQSARNATAG